MIVIHHRHLLPTIVLCLQGGVGVALGLYDVTVAFVTCHLASKRPDMRRAQYSELVDRLGAKLGGRGFGLNESFHHIIWTGDLNYHVKGVTAREAVAAIAKGEHMQLLLDHDELLDDKERCVPTTVTTTATATPLSSHTSTTTTTTTTTTTLMLLLRALPCRPAGSCRFTSTRSP